ncbi:MAG: sporulation protein YunB [Firmicutes bacterium]|nr:sporulation protein YunB [Bacillota bacterium]
MFLWGKRTIKRFFHDQNYNLLSFLILCLLVFLLFKGFWSIEKSLRPAILSLAQVKAHALAVDAINKAIVEEVAHGVYYQDLISIKLDNEGRIAMAQINTVEINNLTAKTTIAAQNILKEIEKEPIKIPLGEVFGSYLVAAYGPKIPIKMLPAGRVSTTLLDSFEEAGINQVRHKIYLDVSTEMRIVVPFVSDNIEVQTTIPLADAIYPGEIPETIVNFIMGAFQPEEN